MGPYPGAEPGAQADAAANAEQTPGADDAVKPEDAKKPNAKKRKRSFWRDLAVIVVAALALTIVLKSFLVQVLSIPSGSMESTLLPGDRILVRKIAHKFRRIARGDIGVFSGAGSWDPPNQ